MSLMVLLQVYCNETDEVFAGATKASKGMDSLVDKDDYFLEIKEGVDVLFMTSLALMYEYALSDIESWELVTFVCADVKVAWII